MLQTELIEDVSHPFEGEPSEPPKAVKKPKKSRAKKMLDSWGESKDLFLPEGNEVCATLQVDNRRNIKAAKRDEETKKKFDAAWVLAELPEAFKESFQTLWYECFGITCWYRYKRKGKFGLEEGSQYSGWSLSRGCTYLFMKCPLDKNEAVAQLQKELRANCEVSSEDFFIGNGRALNVKGVKIKVNGHYDADKGEYIEDERIQELIDLNEGDIDGSIQIKDVINRCVKVARKLPWCLTEAEAADLKAFVHSGVFVQMSGYLWLKRVIKDKIHKYFESVICHPIKKLDFGERFKKSQTPFQKQVALATTKQHGVIEVKKVLKESSGKIGDPGVMTTLIEQIDRHNKQNQERKQNLCNLKVPTRAEVYSSSSKLPNP